MNLVTAGIDVASTRALHVRISEHFEDGSKIALFLDEVEDFDQLSSLMERYRVRMAAIDHLPEHRLARRFAENFAGRVYLVSYSTHQREPFVVDDEQRRASVLRTEALDATLEQIRAQRNLLPLDLPQGYVEHLQAPVRFIEQNDLGRMIVAYRSTGPDDFAHAEAYDLVARSLWDYRQQVAEASTPRFDALETVRSRVNDYNDFDYSPGPPEPDFFVLDGATGRFVSAHDLVREYTPWLQ